MISVIIPSYRNPKYLDLCLHSLTRGQYNNNEIVVVLDGYVKESEMVVNKYKGIDVIALPENKGMQHALNIGVWNANNEKIFIINDDNVFAPNWDKKLESQYSPDEVLTINQIEPTGPGMFNFPVLDCGQTIETFDMEKFIDEERRLSVNKKTPDGNIFPFLINKKWYMAKNAEAQKFREREAFAMQQYYYKWGVPPHNGVNNTKFPNGDTSTIRGLNV